VHTSFIDFRLKEQQGDNTMETKEKRLESLAEDGYKARKDAEDFLNRWLNDGTKGWAVRSDSVNRYGDHLSSLLVINFN